MTNLSYLSKQKNISIIFVLYLLFFSLEIFATEINVGFGYAKPPFVFALSSEDQDEDRGIELQIMKEALAYRGYSMKANYISNDNLIPNLEYKIIDAAATVAMSEKEGLYYSDEFVYFWNYAVTQPDDIKKISSVKELEGRKVIAWKDASKDLGSDFKKTTATMAFYKEAASQEQQVLLFLQKKADTLVIDWHIFYYWAKKHGYDPIKYNQHDIFDGKTQYRVAFRDSKLRDDFNEGLSYLKSSGRYEDIYNKLWANLGEISLSKDEQAYLEQKGALKLCFDPDWMPFEAKTKDDKLDGISSDYLAIFTERIGLEVLLYPTSSWSDSVIALKNRECDFILLAKSTNERKVYLDFTTPYLSFSYVVVTQSNQNFIDEFDSILEKKYAVVKGYAVASDLKKYYPLLDFVEVANTSEGLLKVKNGEIFGYIDSTPVVSRVIQQEGLDLKISVKLPIGYDLSVATRNDEPLLHTILQKAVDTITPEDKYRIENKWLVTNIEHVIAYTLVYKILFGGALLFLFIIYWYKRLQQLNIKLVENKKFLQSVLDNSPHAIIATDPSGTITLFNKSAQFMLGYTSDELVAKDTPLIFHDMSELEQRREELCKELEIDVKMGFDIFAIKSRYGLENKQEWKFITKNKKTIIVNLSVNALRKKNGKIDGYIGVAEDITQRKMDEKKLAQYVDIMDEYVLSSSTNLSGNIIEASKAFCRLTGYSKEELIGKKHNKLRHMDMKDTQYKLMWETITNNEIYSSEIKNKRKDGSIYWVNSTIFPLLDDENNKIGYMAIRQDITDKKRIEELSITDELTKLYNRRHFNKVLKEELNRAKRKNKNISFLMLDVDHFKLYNDTYGHQEGDTVLSKIGKVLNKHSRRAGDFAFRLGGEEFGIIFHEQNTNQALEFANNLLKEIEGLKIPHSHNSASEYVTVSIGLVYKNVDINTTQEEIYKEADDNLYRAKELGRNRVVNS